ncbi:MAG: replication initiation factor domain-containing protein [Cytophagales bacterium]|nr:replication initiation factor domain-containing protein [Cytophagales bacterium]
MSDNFDKYNNSNITIAVDWFEFFGNTKCSVLLNNYKPDEKKEFQTIDYGYNLVVLNMGHGTPMYNVLYEIYVGGELFASLQTHPRFVKGDFKDNSISFKIANNQLYSDKWVDNMAEIMDLLKLKINNITRLDICIDGCNGVLKFLNSFVKQTPESKSYIKMGKATMSSCMFDSNTLSYSSFTFGKRTSDKYLIVYNKTKELERSNKKYIEKFWLKNGLMAEIVYRVEIRLTSKVLAQIQLTDISMLLDTTYLASLFRTASDNFFHFKKNTGDTNKSREQDVNLIPYELLCGELLAKSQRPKTTHRYKAKLTIRKCHFDLNVKENSIDSEIMLERVIQRNIDEFDLQKWYLASVPTWLKEYKVHKSTGHVYSTVNYE